MDLDLHVFIQHCTGKTYISKSISLANWLAARRMTYAAVGITTVGY